MAERGTSKRYSEEHERFIARLFGGLRSVSSGAANNDAGDVRTEVLLIECKMTGVPGTEPKKLPVFVRHFEKVADEAWQENKQPVLALRYYQPNSNLADRSGWVDLTLMLARDLAS